MDPALAPAAARRWKQTLIEAQCAATRGRADDVSARYDAGVLEVRVPMKQATPEPTKITVQRTENTK